MVIIGEKYLRIEISRLIMIAHTHVRARAHPTESHETPCLFCSCTRNSLQQKTFIIESPISLNRPRTISIPNLSSLVVSWPPQVSLLHDLIFVPRFVKVLPLAWSYRFCWQCWWGP